MENPLPETLVLFLNSILEAQTQADQWKSKLFYVPPEQYFALITAQNEHPEQTQTQQVQKSNISLCQILKFIENCQDKSLDQQEQKVIQKYFGFSQKLSCTRQSFGRKLKPINNKLILSIQRQQIVAEQCLAGLFQSILSGYKRIKPHREQCANQFQQVFSYFMKQQFHNHSSKGLSRESLKQFMFQANIYGRINFMYIKEYIFGSESEEIQWKTLFGLKESMMQFERIVQLEEENIPSEAVLKEDQEEVIQDEQDYIQVRDYQNNRIEGSPCIMEKSIILESVSQINNFPSQPISKVQLTYPVDNNYNKTLDQINQIQELLNKTKQKYQKNRQDLENQTKFIKSQQLRRAENSGKLSYIPKPIQKQQTLEIPESIIDVKTKVQPKKQTNIQQASLRYNQKFNYTQYIDRKNNPVNEKLKSPSKDQYKTTIIQFSNNKDTKSSEIRPIMTRQAMRQQIESTIQSYKCPQQISQFTERRDTGKIKKRSVSKDIEKDQTLSSSASSQKCSFNPHLVPKTEYNEYQAVLKQIKQQENEYKRQVEQREKLIYQKETRQRLSLNTHSSTSHMRYSPIGSLAQTQFYKAQKQPQLASPQSYQQSIKLQYRVPSTDKRPMSQSRYDEIIREIQINSLSRSRVSSKKREEIVQKATSQARLRIQEIENRALNRLAKIDQDESLAVKKVNTYLKLSVNEKQRNYEMPKYRKIKQNTPSVKTQQSPRNLFINDLLNQRPVGLKLSSNFIQKF